MTRPRKRDPRRERYRRLGLPEWAITEQVRQVDDYVSEWARNLDRILAREAAEKARRARAARRRRIV